MGLIINTYDITKQFSQIKRAGDRIILVGGCFDVLHAGHIKFLKKAKKLNGMLVILLESDENIKKTKGEKRPINNQAARARVLSGLNIVDAVICLTGTTTDYDYEMLVKRIEPDIIAVTKGTKIYAWEKEYITKTGKKIVEVMEKEKNHSTTRLAQKLKI